MTLARGGFWLGIALFAVMLALGAPAGLSDKGWVTAALTVLIGSAPFSDSTSMSIGHAVRSFASFQAASEEAGRSRVYAGVHFPSGNVGGLALGRCIGGRVGMIFTRPWMGVR